MQGRGRGLKETAPGPRRSGAAPRSLLTWPEDSSRDQETEDQTAGRSRLRCHIPPPPGPPTESAPQEGGVVPSPALPARSRFGMQGAAASPRHTTAPWAVALHLLVSAARNFPPRRPQLLLPPFSALALGTLGCSSRDRRPALPGRHLSNSERCTWFFSAGLLFPFSWNNNSGSGSVHKKPGARKESSGMATGSGGSRRSGLPQVAAAVAAIAATGTAAAAAALRAALSGGTGRRV